ncbi:hypothetical protein Tsp_03483 [Trichinella spiralis]|uniref:hypothetical protein n=1 Tax=Trichinella spiralis TaxID=6334 RepID=UPI0001EFB227|nr:hypothetical protein Tsp_03483 [Trichinella spiralis]
MDDDSPPFKRLRIDREFEDEQNFLSDCSNISKKSEKTESVDADLSLTELNSMRTKAKLYIEFIRLQHYSAIHSSEMRKLSKDIDLCKIENIASKKDKDHPRNNKISSINDEALKYIPCNIKQTLEQYENEEAVSYSKLQKIVDHLKNEIQDLNISGNDCHADLHSLFEDEKFLDNILQCLEENLMNENEKLDEENNQSNETDMESVTDTFPIDEEIREGPDEDLYCTYEEYLHKHIEESQNTIKNIDDQIKFYKASIVYLQYVLRHGKNAYEELFKMSKQFRKAKKGLISEKSNEHINFFKEKSKTHTMTMSETGSSTSALVVLDDQADYDLEKIKVFHLTENPLAMHIVEA